MNLTEKMKKPFWVRKVAGTKPFKPRQINENEQCYVFPCGIQKADEIYLTEEDFLREIEPSAHEQMRDMQSSCPVWKQMDDPNDPTKKKWLIDHYDDVEVTTFGIQKRGANAFVSHMAGKGFGIANETKRNKEIFDLLCSWKDIVGINTTAFMEICKSLAYTCDAAVYQYTVNGNSDIEYKVFSYLYGDILFQHLDENRNPVVYRKYTLNNRTAVDVFSVDRVQTWVANKGDKEEYNKWYNGIKGWVARITNGSMVGQKSEDGYTCIYDAETQTPDNMNPCTYFRVSDLRSGSSQTNIESYERAASFVAEEYKESAFPDLLIKAEKIVSLPPRGKHGRTFGVKGTAENLKAADVKAIEPADASNIATLNLTTKWNDIRNTMMSVYIDPEILKSGADSSTTIKILFTPELQYCQLMWIQLFKPLKQAMNVFKSLVGKVENRPEEFSKLRISIYPDFWIPNNTSEEVDQATKLVYAGILSQENARSMLDLQYLNDAKIVSDEKERDLYQKTFVPLKAKYDAEQKYGVSDVADDIVVDDDNTKGIEDVDTGEARVDNNADRKSITE
jgi:hypothetical protein